VDYARKGDAGKRRKASKTNVATGVLDLVEHLKRLQACLVAERETLVRFNRSREHKKRVYDRKAEKRHFALYNMVVLFNPAMKAGLTKNFCRVWTGPYKITRKVSELKYEIMSRDS
jgi:hypothetical protein